MVTVLLCSCAEQETSNNLDTIPVEGIPPTSTIDNSPYGIARFNLITVLPFQPASGWINVDSVQPYGVVVSHAVVGLLFPQGFEIPSEVSVKAIAKQGIDSATDAIWYHMEVKSNDGPDNQDIWMVLYNDTAAIAAHCFATRGVGYGYAKMDSEKAFREVFVDAMEKTVVTTKSVAIRNGQFIISDEESTTFGIGNEAYPKSQAFIDEYFR